ncbi:MAG: hypothetical protein QNJ09_16995 [Paracoccaceae bacterium]|nr:hypothetical protein [Paracoccaceae bacterium]
MIRLEKLHAAIHFDLQSLTDEQLVARVRDLITLIGVDWEAFENNPARTAKDSFDGYEDEDGLLGEFLHALENAGTDWLRYT